MRYLWLHKILPAVEPDYNVPGFATCERDVIGPALEEAGYVLRSDWFTGDGDSFDPLTRCIKTDKGIVVYG